MKKILTAVFYISVLLILQNTYYEDFHQNSADLVKGFSRPSTKTDKKCKKVSVRMKWVLLLCILRKTGLGGLKMLIFIYNLKR